MDRSPSEAGDRYLEFPQQFRFEGGSPSNRASGTGGGWARKRSVAAGQLGGRWIWVHGEISGQGDGLYRCSSSQAAVSLPQVDRPS
jgi:hypothetical protein